jgi:outer membrane protein TolC
MCTLLEELVTQRQEERRLTEAYVKAGVALADVLNQVDARLADARARLAQARSK